MKASTQTFLATGLLLLAAGSYVVIQRSEPDAEPMEPSRQPVSPSSPVSAPASTDRLANPPAGSSETWKQVWAAIQAFPVPGGYLPQVARTGGPPLFDESRVLFRFDAPPGTERVYLAGNFNHWAQNASGRVGNRRFAMQPGPDGIWFELIDRPGEALRYRYVVENAEGEQQWAPDPQVREKDGEGNSVVKFSIRTPAASTPRRSSKLEQRRDASLPRIEVEAMEVRALPGQAQALQLSLPDLPGAEAGELRLRVVTPIERIVYEQVLPAVPVDGRVSIPGIKEEGGYRVEVALLSDGEAIAAGQAVVSVVRDLGDDLRYGFFASYDNIGGDYDAKARLLANAHINAVEYYDYFPAHGNYAPSEPVYTFEPFGTRINALDVQRKIEAGHQRGILSLAYVAAYAASPEVYRQYPYPMTNRYGEPKIFNGSIMTESEAEAQGRPKWFWLMDVSRGSQWYDYIMQEFARTLDGGDGDLVSFDGFEIDTYGDEPGARFYAQGSRRNGDLLSEVLQDFVNAVRVLTKSIKPLGLVSFNSVNEFGVEQMYAVTDFLFLEIWRDYTDRLAELVDICYYHRSIEQQRVVLKLYPVDMDPAFERWPPEVLARVLGATMTGGGSLMVAGEPDETNESLHSLRSLYYPDHQPLSAESESVLRDYYRHDAMLYGYTHGKAVSNTRLNVSVPGGIVRSFAAPAKQALVVQVLNPGDEPRWSRRPSSTRALESVPFTIDLPGGAAPRRLYFASPDAEAFRDPVELDFDLAEGRLTSSLPFVQFHATVILQY